VQHQCGLDALKFNKYGRDLGFRRSLKKMTVTPSSWLSLRNATCVMLW
jgi:hypothetical protein